MNDTVTARSTDRDEAAACEYTGRIIAESMESDKWMAHLDAFAALLSHPKSPVRNRAVYPCGKRAMGYRRPH